jgi:hypothetical protein
LNHNRLWLILFTFRPAKNTQTARKGTKKSLSAILFPAFFAGFDPILGIWTVLVIVFSYNNNTTIVIAYVIACNRAIYGWLSPI